MPARDSELHPIASTQPLSAVTRVDVMVLAAILLLGCAIRMVALFNALHTPGYAWEDPDGYLSQALRLVGPNGWSWTFEAVTYQIKGQQHALPPLYSVFLSLFVPWPRFPLTAQVAQVCLAVVGIALVFFLGRRLHSTRAGLIAAAGHAVWVPSIFGVWSTSQETLYIPIILAAFVLLRARSIATGWRASALPAWCSAWRH